MHRSCRCENSDSRKRATQCHPTLWWKHIARNIIKVKHWRESAPKTSLEFFRIQKILVRRPQLSNLAKWNMICKHKFLDLWNGSGMFTNYWPCDQLPQNASSIFGERTWPLSLSQLRSLKTHCCLLPPNGPGGPWGSVLPISPFALVGACATLTPGVLDAAGAPIKPKVPGIPRTPWAQSLLQEQLSLLLAKQAIHENCQGLRIFCFLKFS